MSKTDETASAIPDDDEATAIDDMMTEEEKAALAEDDDEDEGPGSVIADDGDEGGDEDDDGGEENAAAAAAQRADDPPADPNPEPSPAPAALALPPKPAAFTQEHEARFGAIDEERKKLISDFGDGEITTEAFEEKIAALAEEKANLAAARTAEAKWHEAAKAADDAAWDAARDAFEAKNKALFAGFAEGATDEQQKATRTFNEILKKLSVSEVAEDLDNAQLLEEAKAIFVRRHPDLAPREAPAEVGKGGKGKLERPAPAKTGRRPMPPSLAQIPTDEMDGAEDGPGQSLDTLAETNPLAYEQAIARMTPEQEDAYLAGRPIPMARRG